MTTKIFLFLALVIAILPGCKKEKMTLDSFIYDTNDNSWGTSDGGFTWSATLPVPEITQAVMDNGSVLVYQQYTSGGITYNSQIPTYYPNPSDALNISSQIYLGNIDIFYESTNTVALPNPGALSYRVVIIHGPGKTGYEPTSKEFIIKTTKKP